MAKPILIIRVGYLPRDNEQMHDIKSQVKENISQEIKDDYHLLIAFEDKQERRIEFQMFSDKEIEPIELEKLKEIVHNSTTYETESPK